MVFVAGVTPGWSGLLWTQAGAEDTEMVLVILLNTLLSLVHKYCVLIGYNLVKLCSDWLPGKADSLLEGGVLRVDQVGEEEQVLCAGDGVTLATLSDLLLLHSKQVTNRRALFRLETFHFSI